MPPRSPGSSGSSGGGGGGVGVVVGGAVVGFVGGAVGVLDAVGRLVGAVVAFVGGAVGTVGGRLVAGGAVGPVVSTICGVGVPVTIVGYGVLATPTGNCVSPGLVAVGNDVATALGVTPGVGTGVGLVRGGSPGMFCVGSPGCGPAIGAAGLGPPPGSGRNPAPIRGPPSRAMKTSTR